MCLPAHVLIFLISLCAWHLSDPPPFTNASPSLVPFSTPLNSEACPTTWEHSPSLYARRLAAEQQYRWVLPTSILSHLSLFAFPSVHIAVNCPFLGLVGLILVCSMQAPNTTIYHPLDPQSSWCMGSLAVQTSQCPMVLLCHCRNFGGHCVAFLFSLVCHGNNCRLITR